MLTDREIVMLRFVQISKARRAAVAQIVPMIDFSRARLGSVPDSAWIEPYMVGFLTMLISLMVKSGAGNRLSSDQLGLAQAELWVEITRLRYENIGEKICILSAAQDPLFESGCQNALHFFQSYDGAPSIDDDIVHDHFSTGPAHDDFVQNPGALPNSPFGHGSAAPEALWMQYFEEQIAPPGSI